MTETPSESNHKSSKWYVTLCVWLWSKRSFVWSAIILNLTLGVIAALLFTSPATLTHLPIGWAFQNPLIILLILVVTASITNIIGQISHLPTGLSNKELKRLYLKYMILSKKTLLLTGVPVGLIAEGVPLDEVFIPLEFRKNRPLADYPLTEEELSIYHALQSHGNLTEEMDYILLESKKNWQNILAKSDRISITDLWQRLTREHPVAVIEGFPGMGKSTLLNRLALHMACRSSGQPDPMMPRLPGPPLIPILLSLAEYTTKRSSSHNSDLSLLDFLKIEVEQLPVSIPNLALFLQRCLHAGQCLVMLDGLDEVSDLEMRRKVKDAIKDFILAQRATSESAATFNRFLIASRVAGLDQNIFSDYPSSHYTIAELTFKQIEEFLPRWCRATAHEGQDRAEKKAIILRVVEQMEKDLTTAIKEHQGVRELAENPLLLTLLAVMQQNSFQLPRRRVELYTIVTRTLLENRNIDRGLPPIPEAQAIRYLGPIAFQMQEVQNSFARQKVVGESLRQTISLEGGSPDQIVKEAESFLQHIRVRGGLFVLRTGDYFGFFHRTFQEYFAARHILSEIKTNSAYWIPELVKMVSRSDDLWREPFLLAVAYESGEDETVSQQILQSLLDASQNADFQVRLHDVLLATECVIEAKALTIGRALESRIAKQLLQTYEEARRNQALAACEQIERVMRHWLLNLPGEAYRPPLLVVLSEIISDAQSVALQRATLTLLTTIAQQLLGCPAIVSDILTPLLLTLAGLPTIDKYKSTPLFVEAEPAVADLALTVLSFLGKQGPAGLHLVHIRQHFRDHPNHLRLLARCSLEGNAVLTPAVVPIAEENYQRYQRAIEQWLALCDLHKSGRITEQEVDICLSIQQSLLACAEEVCYPSSLYLLSMLKATAECPSQPWQNIWQKYLEEQMVTGNYVNYQEAALLWAMIFPEGEALERLVSLLWEHYNADGKRLQSYAQRFLVILSTDLYYLRFLRVSHGLDELQNLKKLEDLHGLRDIRYLRYIQYLHYLRYLRYQGDIPYLQYMRTMEGLRCFRMMRDLRDFQRLLLTSKSAEKAMKQLSTCAPSENVEVLTILLGRVLQIQEAGEEGPTIESEVQQLIQSVLKEPVSTSDDKVYEIVLNIIRALPCRSANEVKFVLLLAEQTDAQVQQACASALEQAWPNSPEAWAFLEAGARSTVEVISIATQRKLQQK